MPAAIVCERRQQQRDWNRAGAIRAGSEKCAVLGLQETGHYRIAGIVPAGDSRRRGNEGDIGVREFLESFTASHFVGLAAIACITYVARVFGRRVGKSIMELNDNLKRLSATIVKTEILWDQSATPAMWKEFERKTREA